MSPSIPLLAFTCQSDAPVRVSECAGAIHLQELALVLDL